MLFVIGVSSTLGNFNYNRIGALYSRYSHSLKGRIDCSNDLFGGYTWFGISLCVSQKDIFEELFYDCLCFITDGIHLNAHSPFGIGQRITYLHLQTDFRISLLVNSEYPYLSLCTV